MGGVFNATKLQSVLAYSTMDLSGPVWPHHPITCQGDEPLRYEEDGTLSCRHNSVGPDDRRTAACLNHSIALLLVELAASL